jgi:periplasmic divalent cation tolerance protein
VQVNGNDGHVGRPRWSLSPGACSLPGFLMDSPAQQPPTVDQFLIVFVTVPDGEVAARVGRTLVEEKLAACVNIVPGLRSIYEYGGKVCDDAEVLCLFKTRRALYPALRDRLTALHPYEVPEIIAVLLAEGNAPYLAWLANGTRSP